MDESALARIERQRAALEIKISKLRNALRHWQTLEIDYEGLREEFLGVPEDSSAEECLKAAKDSKPDLVNEKELQELLLDNNSRPRRPVQLVDLLSKRVDYVMRNVETIRKQLSDAEKKRNAILLAEEPDHRDEAGLPLAEIVEELDDSGQILTSKVQTQGSDAPQLLHVLRKAGVEDLAETSGTITEVLPPSKDVKKDVAESVGIKGEGLLLTEPRGRAVHELDPSPDQFPTNPQDTPEEAELRQDMLAYSRGLDEVGAIVAELELEENASDVSYDENEVDLEFDSHSDVDEDLDEESEDETGKSKHSLSLSRDYETRLAGLQEKLGLKNVGNQPEAQTASNQASQVQRLPAAAAARKAAIARDENSKSNLKSATKKAERKRVAFSSELDMAPETTPPPTTRLDTTSIRDTGMPRLRPINDSIVERIADEDENEPSVSGASLPTTVKKSRFKATRQVQPQTPMFARPMKFPSEETGDEKSAFQPPFKTVTRDLVERPSSKTAKAPDLNDFSDEAHRREIATEYQQHHMNCIRAQDGGFLGNGEEGEITPLEDEETGRRVSRFKAARIKH